MNTVLTRLLQPAWLLVGLVLLSVLAALALLIWGMDDPEHLVAPFRWVPLKNVA
jgi:hypothetical protein